jgi:glycosyltransferase involved in cell wall biosynthesis
LRPWLPRSANYLRVRNPINIEKAPPSVPSNNRVFTFVGRLSPEKGAAVFASAARLADVGAVFVGSGRESLKIPTLNPDAILLGWQARAGVIQAIRSSRAIVFPSLWHETQGLVVMEAAAVGVPAVVSDACAARDNIVDGVSGLLFRAGDVADLAAKLRLLDSDQQLVEALGKAAYEQYWASPCTLYNHVQDLVGCYNYLMRLDGLGQQAVEKSRLFFARLFPRVRR